MALRTSFKRLPLSVSSPLVARSLTTSTAAAAVRPSAFAAARTAPRFFSTTKCVALEASAVVGDGGNTEPPEHGINVDKSMRMDALVSFLSYRCGRQGHACDWRDMHDGGWPGRVFARDAS